MAAAMLATVGMAGERIDGLMGHSSHAIAAVGGPDIGLTPASNLMHFTGAGTQGGVSVMNRTDGALTGLAFTVDGDFALDDTDCPDPLPAEASCTASVSATVGTDTVEASGGRMALSGGISVQADGAEPNRVDLEAEALAPLGFTAQRKIQTWTVPADGRYRIDAMGARGGRDGYNRFGGAGAHVSTVLHLTAGETLNLVVGGRGGDGDSHAGGSGGGGGGSFVSRDRDDRLLIAAGGGGGGSNAEGCDARADLLATAFRDGGRGDCDPLANPTLYGASWRGDTTADWEGSETRSHAGDGGFGGGGGAGGSSPSSAVPGDVISRD